MKGEKFKMASIGERIKHAWDAFRNKDPTYYDGGFGSYSPPFFQPFYTSFGNSNVSLVDAVYNRIAIDVANVTIRHVVVNENDEFDGYIKDSLDYCLTQEANADQTSFAFFQDVVMSMFNERSGCVAIVPTKTNIKPDPFNGFEIYAMRVGEILEWKVDKILVKTYNEDTGLYHNIWCDKKTTAIILNPFYSVVNKPNSTVKRLNMKSNLQDSMENAAARRLNMIVTLPYAVKTEIKMKQAKKRLDDINKQMDESPYGIVYADAAERITQLNRPIESGIQTTIEFLTNSFFSQMSMTESILNGTANETEMANYMSRTVNVIVKAIVNAMKRSFLTYIQRVDKHESIMFFRDPFEAMSVNDVAEFSDKMTRNEIMSSNEVRRGIGLRPDPNKKSDELVNKNINHPEPDQ